MHACMCVCTFMCVHVCTCMHACVYVCTCATMRVHVCTCKRVSMYMYFGVFGVRRDQWMLICTCMHVRTCIRRTGVYIMFELTHVTVFMYLRAYGWVDACTCVHV